MNKHESDVAPGTDEDWIWWKDGVIYQIYPRSFADSNGDGIGDLQGILEHLSYLQGDTDSLGVDALWLSPIYPSPMHDFGYDISDYEGIDPMFGSLADFDRLVQAAHQRGLRVVMDLVMNHTSVDHPWFVEARSHRSSPYRDWFLWQDGRRGRPPNGWLSAFGGSAWQWDAMTGQYYYHAFLKEQPDLNWRNPSVEDRMFDMVRFWLERGVDGFRLDVVNCYYKDAELRRNPRALGLRPFDWQKHVYDRDRPEMLGLLERLRRVLDAYPQRMTVGEVFGQNPQIAASYCGDGRNRLDQTFDFHFFHQPFRARAYQDAILAWERALHPGAWPCYVLNNHDFDRAVTRHRRRATPDAVARVLAGLLLTLRGTPYLYYGEELGMANTPIPRAEIQDPPGKRYWPFYGGRDPVRTPMPWHGGTGAGFTSGEPWLRLPEEHQTRNVASQQQNPGSILSWYKALLRIRRAVVPLRRGDFVPLQARPDAVLAYRRSVGAQQVVVGLNFSPRPQTIRFDAPLELPSAGRRWIRRLSSRASAPLDALQAYARGEEAVGEGRLLAEGMALGPHEVCIWEADAGSAP